VSGEVLVEIAEAVRRTAFDVFDATPRGAPAISRWTVGDPASFCCGAITVIFRRVSPILQPTAAGGRPVGNGNCEAWLWSSDWTLDVSRDCPPGLGSVYNILPSPEAEREADTLLLLDAATIYQDFAPLVQKAATTAVVSSSLPRYSCVSMRPGLLTPYTAGDCVGIRFDFTLGLSA
jgi:hypothetical protein